jgi:hypothetical protein
MQRPELIAGWAFNIYGAYRQKTGSNSLLPASNSRHLIRVFCAQSPLFRQLVTGQAPDPQNAKANVIRVPGRSSSDRPRSASIEEPRTGECGRQSDICGNSKIDNSPDLIYRVACFILGRSCGRGLLATEAEATDNRGKAWLVPQTITMPMHPNLAISRPTGMRNSHTSNDSCRTDKHREAVAGAYLDLKYSRL